MNLRRVCLIFLCLLFVSPFAANAQTNIRAWHAKGQTWVVWQTSAPLPLAYSVYRSANAFTSTSQAMFCGQVFDKEWGADTRLKLASPTANWRVPMPDGSTYQLAADEGLFVYTPHAAANEYFAVVTYGATSVPASGLTPVAVTQGYDPVNDPVTCHIQLQGTNPATGGGAHPYTVYAMWVDGRDDVNDARPDFPVLANAPKNGAPHMFAIYEPNTNVGLPAGTFPATMCLHGGGSTGTYWNWRPWYAQYNNINVVPTAGITIGHDDRVYRAANGQVSEESPSYWMGWYSTMLAIDPPPPPDNAVVVPYTLRRLVWIQDWIATRSAYAGRVDPQRVSVLGTSMGGFGSHLIARNRPDLISSASAFVPVMGHPDNGAANKWLGSPTQNLATTETGRNSAVLHVNDLFSPLVQLSPLRDRAFTRFYRGRQEVDEALTKYGWEEATIPAQFQALNDLGIGAHLYWDNRDHGTPLWSTDNAATPEVDIGEWIVPVRTQRGEAGYQEKYRADQSYPGFFNDDQDTTAAGRQPSMGNGMHNDGAPWGTWSGYYDWDVDTLTDSANSWACTMFLIGQSSRSVDNYPGTAATCDVSVRKPQNFMPATGAAFAWEWRNVSGNTLVQSGNGVVGADDVVVVTGLQMAKDPNRRRLTITTSSGPVAPAITSAPVTSAAVGALYTYTITTTGNPTPALSASGLPAWLTQAGNTLSGTPPSAGTFGPVTITATNGVNPNATQSFPITVAPTSDPNAPSNVRAFHAAGQTFIVWQLNGTGDPLTYDVYRGASAFTDTAQATLAGRVFKPEWQGDRLKLAGSTLTWRIPTNNSGGTYQLAANEGLFVFTPHAAGSEYFAIVRTGSTAVSAGNRTATAIGQSYDPVNVPVRCHLQFTGTTTRNYPFSAYAMWADGRDDGSDSRPDFPIMANAAKNGAPHVFAVYEPLAGLPSTGTYPAVLCLHGGGTQGTFTIFAPESGVTANCGNGLAQGIAVSHDDRVFMVNSTGSAVDSNVASFWVGWSPTMNPFAVLNLNTTAAPVVPYTQRRVIWIQDWLEQRSPYRIDTTRVSLFGTSMGGGGASMLARRYPERFAAASCFVPAVFAAENTANARRLIGLQSQNLATTDPAPGGGTLRINDYWNHATRLSVTQRDVPFMRFYRGRAEFVTSTTVPEWSASTVIAAFDGLNATGWGAHLFWDQRDHSPSNWTTEDAGNPLPDIGEWVSPVVTDRPSRTSIIRYRNNQSFPAFFNDDQNSSLAGRQPSMGNGDPLDGDPWGTWSGYYDWDQSTISDTPGYWACTMFLTGLSSVSVDNYPGTTATASVAIRRPQLFAPSSGASLSWRLRRVSDGIVLQSGAVSPDASGLVSISGLTIHKDPVRTRLEVYPAAQPPALGLGTSAEVVANTLAQLANLRIETTGPDAGKPVISVNGLTGLNLLVEYSDDMAFWQTLASATLTGSVDFIDTTTPRPPKRFYRLRLP